MTDLWLVRHGEAVSQAVDPSRPLSEDGARAISSIASVFSKDIGMPARVASSVKLRARQTADIFCAAVGYPIGLVEETAALSPDADPEKFISFLEERQATGSILCVGHLPSIALIASSLVSGSDPHKFAFAPGSVCRIRLAESKAGAGELLLFR